MTLTIALLVEQPRYGNRQIGELLSNPENVTFHGDRPDQLHLMMHKVTGMMRTQSVKIFAAGGSEVVADEKLFDSSTGMLDQLAANTVINSIRKNTVPPFTCVPLVRYERLFLQKVVRVSVFYHYIFVPKDDPHLLHNLWASDMVRAV